MTFDELREKKLESIAKKLERSLKEEGYVKPDYTINYEVDGNTLTMEVDFNYFLADSRSDVEQFNATQRNMELVCSGVGELRVETGKGAYFGGPAASSLIKRGKMVSADALLSTCQVTLTFASNFK